MTRDRKGGDIRRDGLRTAPEGAAMHTPAKHSPAKNPSSKNSHTQKNRFKSGVKPGGSGAGNNRFRKPAGDLITLYGYHAVHEALIAAKRPLLDLFATPGAAERISAEAKLAGVTVHTVDPADLDRRLGVGAVHQGLMLEAGPLPALDISDIERRTGVVLALDQITDPHNVGAILRTAAAFAVDALVVTDRHAPDFSGVLAKSASGGLEHVPVVAIVNLARALDELGDMGYLRVGLDSQGDISLDSATLSRPMVLVLGSEGAGLRRLTRERCDIVARLDMPGAIKSLNVSNACAVALTIANRTA